MSSVTESLVAGQSTYYELLWEQLSAAQRGTLQALAERGQQRFIPKRPGMNIAWAPHPTVQKALQALDSSDILDRYKDRYFFLDPLFPCWIRKKVS